MGTELVIKLFLGASLFFLLAIILYVFLRNKSGNHEKNIKRLLIISLLLILSIWSLRFSVGYYVHFYPHDEIPSMEVGEEIFNSLVHTLQSFSMDEDYTNYVTVGKDMIKMITKDGSVWISVYGVYSSLLNIFAVVAGGAILFDLLSEFFPKLRLGMAKMRFWKKKYYFSELNDKSLALAISVHETDKSNPVLIFADAYLDDEDEGSSERMLSAQNIGAICVKDDFMHIGIRQLGKKSIRIFLIDDVENLNVQALATLLEQNDPMLEHSEIYVFAEDSHSSRMDEELTYIIDQHKNTNRHLPAIFPINGIRNMTINLLRTVPLYEPLIGRKDKKKLNVTILGSGVIGMEVFLNTYWIGQIQDRELHVCVVSKEKRNKVSTFDGQGDFEGRINNVNPDILATEKSRCGDGMKPYFSLEYRECDVLQDDLTKIFAKDPENEDSIDLRDTDYFVVNLGTDEDNFSVASQLKKIIGLYHLEDKEAKKKTVISYVIYNSHLCNALNGFKKDNNSPKARIDGRDKCRFNYNVLNAEKNQCDVYLHAFGSLEEVYGVENVFFENIRSMAESGGAVYREQSKKMTMAQARRESMSIFSDIYSYEANIGRATHLKYKIFSAGCYERSLFTLEKHNDDQTVPAEYDAEQRAALDRYLNKIYVTKLGHDRKLIDDLGWLEHRRWVAFMRIKGFRNPVDLLGQDALEKYEKLDSSEHSSKKGSHKFLALKLHTCLVEADEPIRAQVDDYGLPMAETWHDRKWEYCDPLDRVSDELWEKDPEAYDFKIWDYPQYLMTAKEISVMYDQKPCELKNYCDMLNKSVIQKWDNLLQSVYRFEEQGRTEYYVTESYFLKQCKKHGEVDLMKKVKPVILKHTKGVKAYNVTSVIEGRAAEPSQNQKGGQTAKNQ